VRSSASSGSAPLPPAPRRVPERDTSMEDAARQAGVLAQASREVSDTSAEAAATLAELRTAIGDISTSTGRASAVAEEAVRDARAVDERIAALQTATESITQFVRLIGAISQQSRFLALNASVEAARAGDLGRGFAVVADEVKELADRTAQAARDIDAQITAVQRETQQAVEAVQRITGTLGSIAEAQDTIAAAVEQQRAATDRVVENVERAAGGSARISDAVGQLAESQRVVYVRRALAVAEQHLADLGGARLGEGRTSMTVRDQSTGATHTAPLPDLLLGGRPLERSDDPHRPTPLVDDVVRQVGGSCTLFQRLDGDGGMVRVATTVLTPAGRRNVGTAIGRIDPDGRPNPVLAAVLAGETYTGAATVADRPYFTAYTGLLDEDGTLMGMLYVGLPMDAMPGTAP
jgi:Cache 3/Cache 2 fusion domain/Methyl-accepting chemotaxis protein (MCP) signalling domain